MTPHSMILRGDSKKFEFISENETKNETNLTHWQLAQASSNDEKNQGSKISLDCPFKYKLQNSFNNSWTAIAGQISFLKL